jgi:hypothetical protein
VHWLLHVLGTDNVSGPAYAFWSGFGGDLAIIGALLWGPVVLLRKHNCEVRRCLRLARHATAAGHQVCRRHHPDGPLSAAAVTDRHRRALRLQRAASGEPGERVHDPERDGELP